jgi:cytochrome d ubiquinol oxidase subunit I
MDGPDPLLLSRIQFGVTIGFHILFPSLNIGLAGWIAILEFRWLRSGDPVIGRLVQRWTHVFAIAFGMGVVSGIVLSYEFGTNWSVFSERTGNVLGPLLAYEVLTAFFLEASFLGIMLFGRSRVPRGVHFFATCMVALGTLISAFWVLAANSWMHTPAGFVENAGRFDVVDWFAVVFNPSFPYRLAHMVTAAYLTAGFVIAGVGAWHLLRGRAADEGRIMLCSALPLLAVLAPLQVFIGDLHGLQVRDYQPAKLAAIEAHWETGPMPLILFAWPDMAAARNRMEIAVPKLGSLIVTHSLDGTVTGLKAYAPEDRPHVPIVFWSFRVMVAIGVVMLFAAFAGIVLWLRGRLFTARWYLRLMTLAMPSGFIAVLAGWITAEVGRQPWIVQGLMRTADGVSPVPGSSVAASLVLFVLVYGVVFSAGLYYMAHLLRDGASAEAASGKEGR